MNEERFKDTPQGKKILMNPPVPGTSRKTFNPLEAFLYKYIPYRIRLRVYRHYYKRQLNMLEPHLRKFPIDTEGYLLYRSLGFKRINYPNDCRMALVITHDVEPTKYAYTKGLPRFLSLLESFPSVKSTFFLVSRFANMISSRVLDKLINYHEIGSHGLNHDRRPDDIELAKEQLEGIIGKKVIGYRAPAWVRPSISRLKSADIKYDVSFMDVQYESPQEGIGTSYFLPYYLDNSLIEMQTTAPDCISPYFFGYGMDETLKLFLDKIEWMHKIGAVFVLLVHVGAWGDKDADLREWLFKNIMKNLPDDCWITSCSSMYEWWGNEKPWKR